MATPKPGEIRCPTCHRSTPPAAFCTQCGSAIPSNARIRPRGMDRDELQERIRARRSGGEPYRRGGVRDDAPPGYERYVPEPEDVRALRERGTGPGRPDDAPEETATGAAGAAGSGIDDTDSPDQPRGARRREALDAALGSRRERVDESPRPLVREPDEWSRPPERPVPVPVQRPAAATAPYAPGPPRRVDNYDDAAYEEGGYEYEDWDDDDRRRGSGGGIAILGFLALGVLALLGGAVLAGLFGDPQTGGTEGSPTPIVSEPASLAPAGSAPAASESAAASTDPGASAAPAASGEPVVFPDGFTAEAQPCLPGSADLDGCDNNGATNSGAVDVWVGFENGTANDVVGAALIGPNGDTVSDGSIDLQAIGCGDTCNGYTRFPFSGLAPGTYEVRITRNGQPASSTTFEVS